MCVVFIEVMSECCVCIQQVEGFNFIPLTHRIEVASFPGSGAREPGNEVRIE